VVLADPAFLVIASHDTRDVEASRRIENIDKLRSASLDRTTGARAVGVPGHAGRRFWSAI
jgi:hypothetical protein